MNFESLAVVGQKIRSYDFPGNKDYFVEGTVVSKGMISEAGIDFFEGYTFEVSEVVQDGESVPFEPYNSVTAFERDILDWEDRIELI